MDFISNIRSILADNSDIGTVSPIFSCDTYVSLFGTVAIDENLYKNGQFHSNIYDAIWTQHCAIYIKYELWNKIGGFCEKFIAPYYVIMDYQLRVLKNGYRNVIALECFLRTDSKINVFCGPIHDVEMTNEIWGLHYLNSWENKSLNNIIREINRENIHNILEVGCASGANLMGLKNSYPDAALYGIELNPHAADIANCFANVVQGNIETDEIPFKDVNFDVIMFGDVLEHLRNPEETIRMCKNYLSENGRIVCSIPNVQHISVLRPLIYGRFEYTEVGLLDKTHIHLFTGQEIVKMFANAGYTIEKMICGAVNLSKEDEEAIVKLRKVFPDTNEIEFKTFQYLVCAKN
jgi:2-polyprenyl-3-methyl-5-hydroxy-6-metoxy-1,4-benzoquinol methylase